jgi:hypothetical protein
MHSFLTYQNLKQFFKEIYDILKNSKLELDEVWVKIDNVKFLTEVSKNYDLDEFVSNFTFMKLERWRHVSVDKLHYILEALSFLNRDIKNLAEILDFRGFEKLIGELLTKNGYNVIKNFRFSDKSNLKHKLNQTRYEIDIIGLKGKYLLLIDGKQWRRKDSFGTLSKSADLQYNRALALTKNFDILSNLVQSLSNLNSISKKHLPLRIIPFMVSLEENDCKFSTNQIPLVSIYRLNSFLQEYRFILDFLKFLEIKKLSIQKTLEVD